MGGRGSLKEVWGGQGWGAQKRRGSVGVRLRYVWRLGHYVSRYGGFLSSILCE